MELYGEQKFNLVYWVVSGYVSYLSLLLLRVKNASLTRRRLEKRSMTPMLERG